MLCSPMVPAFTSDHAAHASSGISSNSRFLHSLDKIADCSAGAGRLLRTLCASRKAVKIREPSVA